MTLKRKIGLAAVLVILAITGFVAVFVKDSESPIGVISVRFEDMRDKGYEVVAMVQLTNCSGSEIMCRDYYSTTNIILQSHATVQLTVISPHRNGLVFCRTFDAGLCGLLRIIRIDKEPQRWEVDIPRPFQP